MPCVTNYVISAKVNIWAKINILAKCQHKNKGSETDVIFFSCLSTCWFAVHAPTNNCIALHLSNSFSKKSQLKAKVNMSCNLPFH